MGNLPFSDLGAYEQFLYMLTDSYATIQLSTLVLIRHGHSIATVRGEVGLRGDVRLIVREQLLALDNVEIEDYGYEIWRGGDLLYWYDAQPHPHIPELQSTHPHHKHVPPDIKHNRVPAPSLSFVQPNLPFLIEEIERGLLS